MTRIMTNISAINGQRNLAKTGLRLGKVLEKLASGYRINRAADDAAGLAISEKMRAQIRGNRQALRNAQDGISMLQTAEGAMDEVHSILQRMRELAVQSANGTYADNGPERTSIGEEIAQLRNEIDRISFSTEFNGQKVLTGALSSLVAGAAATSLVSGEGISAVIAGLTGSDLVNGDTVTPNVTATTLTVASTALAGTYTSSYNATTDQLTLTGPGGLTQTLSVAAFAAAGAQNLNFTNLGINVLLTATAAESADNIGAGLVTASNDTIALNGTGVAEILATTAKPQTYNITTTTGTDLTLTGTDGTTQTIAAPTLAPNGTATIDFNQLGIQLTLSAGPGGRTPAQIATDLTSANNNSIVVAGSGNVSTLQVGANVPDTLALTFLSMQSDQLGSLAFKLGGSTGLISTMGTQVVKTITDAHNLMSALDGAIQTLNSTRGTLGAAQNRLEHTINSLGVSVENLSVSESRIRDADIAELSSDMVAANILQSAGVSVLAQANQTPQAVLQLLQR